MKLKSLAPAAAVALLALVPAGASSATLRVQSTTDTKDAGLLVGLIQPSFDAAFPNDKLDYVGVGTGKALDNARTGIADVVITHAPSLEAKFVQDGYSLEAYGHAIFYSDYVILGPLDDPAGVFASAPHDAITAFEKIAAAGDAGKATFLSRGENSGTNVQEQIMWGLTNIPKKKASNAGTEATRFEPATATDYPGGGGLYPAWYKRTGKGQALNVQETDVCPAATYPNGGCYTMVDRGTFNKLVNERGISKLKVVADKNAPTARGGENLLVNPFSAYIVNPDKFDADTKAKFNVAFAQRFVDLLVSPTFQAAVDSFPTAADPAFRGDAFPLVSSSPALPTAATVGATVPISLTVSNKLPGGGTIDGIPVTLEQSADGGKTWVTAIGATPTDATGKVSFAPVISATTTYRVSVPRYRQFTAGTTILGVVSATPIVVPPAKDTVRPTVSKAKLTSKKLSFTVSEAGTVKATIKRKVIKVTKKNGKTKRTTTYKTVKTLTFTATKAGTVSRNIKSGLKAGVYHVTFAATDKAGNKRSRTVSITIQAASKRKAG